MERQTHYSIELNSTLSAQLWQVLTESFDVEILRHLISGVVPQDAPPRTTIP